MVRKDAAIVAPYPHNFVEPTPAASAITIDVPSSAVWLPYASLAAFLVVLAAACQRLWGWPLAATFLITSPFVLFALGFLTLVTHGKLIGFMMERSRRYAIHRHADHIDAQESYRHQERMAEIADHCDAIQNQIDELAQRLLPADADPIATPNYVANKPDPIRSMALGWVVDNLYQDGMPHPHHVLPDGRLHEITGAWTSRGEWKGPQGDKAKQYLLDHEVIAPAATGKGWRLCVDHFPTETSIGRIT